MQFDIFIEPILGTGAYIVIIDFLLNPTAHFMSENNKHTILDPAGQLTVLLLGLCTRCHNVSRLNEMLWTDDLSGERHYMAVTEATDREQRVWPWRKRHYGGGIKQRSGLSLRHCIQAV